MEAVNNKPAFKVLNTSDCYNRMTFLIEGLPEGKAETIAVAIRRNLIGFIPGLAPAAMTILGANQLYAPVKGLVQDTNALSIIIKNLRVRAVDTTVHDVPYQFVVEIDKVYSNECIKFRDFKLADEYNHIDFEVLNPEEVLTYVGDVDVPVKIRVLIQYGIGYSAYNVINKAEDMPAEFAESIKIDSLFSPILHVSYEIKKQTPSQGQDSIQLTVETDGSVGPIEAVRQAAETLRADAVMISDLFDIHLQFKDAQLDPKFDTEYSRPNQISEGSEIEMLNLPTDLYDLAKDNSLDSIKALMNVLFADAKVEKLSDMKVDKEILDRKDEILVFLEKAGFKLEKAE